MKKQLLICVLCMTGFMIEPAAAMRRSSAGTSSVPLPDHDDALLSDVFLPVDGVSSSGSPAQRRRRITIVDPGASLDVTPVRAASTELSDDDLIMQFTGFSVEQLAADGEDPLEYDFSPTFPLIHRSTGELAALLNGDDEGERPVSAPSSEFTSLATSRPSSLLADPLSPTSPINRGLRWRKQDVSLQSPTISKSPSLKARYGRERDYVHDAHRSERRARLTPILTEHKSLSEVLNDLYQAGCDLRDAMGIELDVGYLRSYAYLNGLFITQNKGLEDLKNQMLILAQKRVASLDPDVKRRLRDQIGKLKIILDEQSAKVNTIKTALAKMPAKILRYPDVEHRLDEMEQYLEGLFNMNLSVTQQYEILSGLIENLLLAQLHGDYFEDESRENSNGTSNLTSLLQQRNDLQRAYIGLLRTKLNLARAEFFCIDFTSLEPMIRILEQARDDWNGPQMLENAALCRDPAILDAFIMGSDIATDAAANARSVLAWVKHKRADDMSILPEGIAPDLIEDPQVLENELFQLSKRMDREIGENQAAMRELTEAIALAQRS